MNQDPINLNDISGYEPKEEKPEEPTEAEMRAFLDQYPAMDAELDHRIKATKPGSNPTKKSSCRSATKRKRQAARKAKKASRK